MVVRQVKSLHGVRVEPTVLPIDGRMRSYMHAAFSILALNFQKEKYDVVHAHTGHSGVLACLQVRSPVVLSYVGYDLDSTSDRERLRRKVERVIFRYLSSLVAASIVKSERAVERLPLRGRARATVLPNGLDRDLFRPLPLAEARTILQWEDEPVILFAADPGRPVKRFELAAAAVAEARKHIPTARLVVCDGVPPNEVPLWMNAADVLLLTSSSEGSPNVVKEAMACNLPVVSVDVGDVANVVGEARNCYVVPADPSSLGEALVRALMALPERSDGRERTDHLDERRIAKRLRHVYEAAAARGPGVVGFVTNRSVTPA